MELFNEYNVAAGYVLVRENKPTQNLDKSGMFLIIGDQNKNSSTSTLEVVKNAADVTSVNVGENIVALKNTLISLKLERMNLFLVKEADILAVLEG